MRARPAALLIGLASLLAADSALAGPETALREFAGGQIKKGVRTIGMGGDGATTGNYALVYKDAGGALFDQGFVRFQDMGNLFTFSAVGFTTPTFWDDAAFYAIALGQQGNGVRVWDMTAPSASKPPSRGDLSDTSIFLKFAKPITKTLSIGFMWAFELSQATLTPDNGTAPIEFHTAYLPSGGAGLHWHPDEHWQLGARVILNHDSEARTQGNVSKSGLLHRRRLRQAQHEPHRNDWLRLREARRMQLGALRAGLLAPPVGEWPGRLQSQATPEPGSVSFGVRHEQ